MKRTDKSGTAFAFECSFLTVYDIAKANGYRVSNVFDANDTVYVTGITVDNVITVCKTLFLSNCEFSDIEYAKLLIAVENDLAELAKQSNKLSRTAIIHEQRKHTPIYRFRKRLGYAEEIGVMPWHHLLFVDNLVYVYIWDTRIVDKVLTVKDTANLSKRMLQEPYDNNAPLVFTEHTEQFRSCFEQLKDARHSALQSMSVMDELDNYGEDAYEMPD